MDDHQIAKIKQLLLTVQRDLLITKTNLKESTQTVDLDQSKVGRLSRMDALQSQAIAKESRRRSELQLMKIEAALERIEEGEFGYCAQCENEINIRRLEVDPATPFCISCAEKMQNHRSSLIATQRS